MSLTKEDLQQIRDVFEGVVDRKTDTDIRLVIREESKSVVSGELLPVKMKLDAMSHRVDALYNDVKDIYRMIADLQKTEMKVSNFGKSNLEQKLVTTYRELQAIAKAEGVTLPE